MTYRPKLFAGIELDDRTREGCAAIASRLEASGFPARFEAPEKLHITLAFLGWVDAERVETIREALGAVARRSERFSLTLDKIGAFPHERRPRVAWIGATEAGDAFRRVAREVRKAYDELGFRFDKDAVAHVTIARVKEGRAHLPLLEVKPMRLNVRTLTLFESVPAGGTTRYEARDRTALL